MNSKVLIYCGVFLFVSSPALAINGYLCVGSQSIGFLQKDNEWIPTTFKTGTYVISKASAHDIEFLKKAGGKPSEWVLKYTGTQVPFYGCDVVQIGLNCGQGDFILSTSQLKYAYTATTSYFISLNTATLKHVPSTAALEIGECSTF